LGPPKKQRVEVPPGVAEKVATVNGCRMRYLNAGSGPPLILIHGLMGFAYSWSENWAGLTSHFTVYAIDLINAGRSERCQQDGSLEAAARQIIGFMDAVGIPKAILAGSSHGGTLAMLAMALAPDRVEQVIAISPATAASEQRRWQARFFSTWVGTIAGYCVPYLAPVVNGYFVSRMYARPERILAGTIESYNQPLKVSGTVPYLLNVMRSWYEEFGALKAKLQHLDQSRLAFLWGDRDLVVPIEFMHELRNYFPHARYVVLKDAGHLPYEEVPEDFNQALLSLAKH
jgi:pimeloyl-ACP methyl ester carboxylesterase